MSPVLPDLESALIDAASRSIQTAPAPRSPRRRRRPARVLTACAVGLVVVTILVLVETTGGSRVRGGPFTAAAAVLDRFAAQAGISAPQQRLKSGEVWYTRLVVGTAYNWQPEGESSIENPDRYPFPPIIPLFNGMYIGHSIITNRLSERTSTGPDGPEDNRESADGPVTFYGTASQRRIWNTEESDPNAGAFGSGTGFSIGGRSVPYAQLLALPQTSSTLLRVIRRRLNAPTERTAPAPATDLVIQALATLLTEPIPSAVRAAAFRALASTPHVRDLGQVHDLLGRPGIGIAYDTTSDNAFLDTNLHRTLRFPPGHMRTEIIFASDSGTLLADEQIWENPPSRFGLPRSLPVNWQAYLSGKVVKAPVSLKRRG